MSDSAPRLLVVDDDPGMLALVGRFAAGEGFDVITRSGGQALLSEWRALKPDVVLLDRNMPDVGGLDILRVIRDADPECQVMLMTADATVESAIEAVKLGALDYLTKPLDFVRLGELLSTVRFGIARRQRLLAADTDLAGRVEFCGMVGRSPVMQELFDFIRRLAPHARTALVAGETGTGKELVARALHKLGPRRDRKFIAFNCSAVVETLFESELFGHTRGAFTGAVEAKAGLFEMADGGTLFLDEIGELPLQVQAKLLRVVEYGEVQRVGASEGKRVDVRAIAATNRQLVEEVAAGRFRQDLYYRLNVVEIALPPLRDRRDDIPCLTAAFIKEFAGRFEKPIAGLSPGAERLLHDAPWPGNIRELRNVLERACMLSEGRMLNEREVLAALGRGQRPGLSPIAARAAAEPDAAEEPVLDRGRIEQALQQVGGNRSAAAKLLGVSRRALYRRLDTFGLR
ncbi:MAG: sigma-54-dependent Fis family transcriptional regulator [Acidobacteria bacterium]|nr:sigma-54-dependent Fis family transcriptional regulator [Acidobacteriota bacterium]